jgi:hypothetical protein
MDLAPKAQSAKPDFMAPSPRVIIEAGGLKSFEDAVQNEEEEEADPMGDLDNIRSVRYYRSEKALGHLYRAIDEHMFLKDLQNASRVAPDQENTMLPTLWTYIQQHTAIIQWEHHLDLARQIRDG